MVRYAGEQLFEQANANVNKQAFGNMYIIATAYGAKGDGVFDNTAIFTKIERLPGQIVMLAEGTYIVNGITLSKRYVGPGKIKLNGVMQAPETVYFQQVPTPGVNNADWFGGDQTKIHASQYYIQPDLPVSTVDSSYFNWEMNPHLSNFWVYSGYSGFTTMTTGTNDSGQKNVNVRNTTDLAAGMQVTIGGSVYTIDNVISSTQFTTTSNLTATYSADTWVSKGNRTFFADYFSQLFHIAGGDAYSYQSRVVAGKSPDADQTHFSYNSTAGWGGGDLTAAVDGVFMTGIELNFIGYNYLGDHDVAVHGDIRSFQRTNDTGANGCVWVGSLYKSEGTKYCEAAHVVSGKWKGGLDLAIADFGTDQAAIKLAATQRIYFNSSGSPDDAGYRMWSQTVGDTYMRYQNANGQMQSFISGANAMSWTTTDLYAAKNIHAGATGYMAINTGNYYYLDGGSNTGLVFDGTNIKLMKNGVQVASW